MSRKLFRLTKFAILAAAAVCRPSIAGTAAPVSLETAHTGWYTEAGRHQAGNENYLAGACCGGPMAYAVQPEHRGFFVFDLASLPATDAIVGAALRMPTHAYHSPDASETLTFYDVSVPVTRLVATRVSKKAFRDLGSGVAYGSQAFTAADDGREVLIPLSDEFVAAANAARGGLLTIGSAVTSLDEIAATREYIFGVESRTVSGPKLELTIGRGTTGEPINGGGADGGGTPGDNPGTDPITDPDIDPTPPPGPGPVPGENPSENPGGGAVPLPATVWMGAAGLAIAGWARRRVTT